MSINHSSAKAGVDRAARTPEAGSPPWWRVVLKALSVASGRWLRA